MVFLSRCRLGPTVGIYSGSQLASRLCIRRWLPVDSCSGTTVRHASQGQKLESFQPLPRCPPACAFHGSRGVPGPDAKRHENAPAARLNGLAARLPPSTQLQDLHTWRSSSSFLPGDSELKRHHLKVAGAKARERKVWVTFLRSQMMKLPAKTKTYVP